MSMMGRNGTTKRTRLPPQRTDNAVFGGGGGGAQVNCFSFSSLGFFFVFLFVDDGADSHRLMRRMRVAWDNLRGLSFECYATTINLGGPSRGIREGKKEARCPVQNTCVPCVACVLVCVWVTPSEMPSGFACLCAPRMMNWMENVAVAEENEPGYFFFLSFSPRNRVASKISSASLPFEEMPLSLFRGEYFLTVFPIITRRHPCMSSTFHRDVDNSRPTTRYPITSSTYMSW